MDKLENMSTAEKLDDNESQIHESLKDNDSCIDDTQNTENNEFDIIEGSQKMQKNADDFIIADTQDLDKIGDDYVPQNQEETVNSIPDCIEETQNTDMLDTNCISETQDTYFEQLDESIPSKTADVSGNVNESQDFHLIDSQGIDDTIPPDVMNNDSMASKELDQSGLNSDSKNTLAKERKDEEADREDVTADGNKEKVLDAEEEEEEEDIIQGTPPPQTNSPSTKQIFPDNRTPSVKRKVDNFDEPPKKHIKLCSEDSLGSEKKDVEFKKSDDTSHVNSIIEETQETEDNEEKLTEDNEKSQLNTNEIDDEKMDDLDMFADLKDGSSVDNSGTDEIKAKTDDTREEESKQLESVDEEDMVSIQEKTMHDGSNDEKNNTETVSNHDNNEKIQEGDEEKKESLDNTEKNAETEDSEKTPNDVDMTEQSCNVQKSRMSIEVIFDKSLSQEQKTKPVEIVEIDEEGEKIVLDSSQEDTAGKVNPEKTALNTTEYVTCNDTKSSSDMSYKSAKNVKNLSVDCKLTNGSTESTPYPDSAASLIGNDNKSLNTMDKDTKSIPLSIKDNDNLEVLSISDNETNSHTDDNMKNKSETDSYVTSLTKATQVEKNIGIYVKLKCLLNIDESSKEFLSKELVAVNCESTGESSTRLKNDDTSASLADISGNDNKDTSPGSVNSNPQLFQLNPSRLSLVSTISSSSSASSAASLAAKLAKDLHFSLPRGPAKHTKKILNDASMDKQYAVDETYDRLSKEWKNHHLLVTNILSFVNVELSNVDIHNLSNERLEQPVQKIRSSTPEAQREEPVEHLDTPKHARKSRGTKRTKAQNVKSYSKPAKLSRDSSTSESSSFDKKLVSSKTKADMDDNTGKSSLKSSPSINQTLNDPLIGQEVFAKWSDNNYYPGTVTDKIKSKYKVAFHDGQHKQLIEDFIIPIPETLKEGLSVYATSNIDEYGSCGIIVDVQTIKDKTHYIVETDEGEKLKVQIKDIFLSPDQAQLLKEQNVGEKSLPSTPKHLGQVTLDNMMDGKRRSKRTFISTPATPKSRRHTSSIDDTTGAEPSSSGISHNPTRKQSTTVSDNENKTTSDSNASLTEDVGLLGVQSEIIGTPNEQTVKGPRSRMKGKQPRSKKKSDDNNEIVTTLGPIPKNSNLFKGMSFIITCASLESLDRYKSTDAKDSNSEFETENEDEWVQTPFVRERLREQIEAGGGKIYDDFNLIPKDEYKNVKLITNVPNLTKKHLQCLSVGIPAYNHKWIIRCCQQNKIVNPAEEQLPAGWSLDKKSYIEHFQRSDKKPLSSVIVMIPTSECDEEFVSLWSQICGNAGAVVLLIEKSASMEDFMEGTVVLANSRCPAWVIKKASELQIPLLSTTWITQCLIEGQICPYDTQERYKYNYVQT